MRSLIPEKKRVRIERSQAREKYHELDVLLSGQFHDFERRQALSLMVQASITFGAGWLLWGTLTPQGVLHFIIQFV